MNNDVVYMCELVHTAIKRCDTVRTLRAIVQCVWRLTMVTLNYARASLKNQGNSTWHSRGGWVLLDQRCNIFRTAVSYCNLGSATEVVSEVSDNIMHIFHPHGIL